ncbi:hypothetical protein S100390_v1c06950 [Spiroplasma sp. NBRC 100390]|uniref:hypothetical protein n=1 Tax=unclassified Spiroplasma TaxID=2637901 RepID=UPI000892839D|nr:MULTISPECIES: hypothetical protein [unclassified Spiroplasma]AOX44031.1 hypothetical protein STU14_v1c06950 [Spiroplasma sp. TU-14]APE13501.1 hypothetical protein S100390_v1c06950 [Spiroplasma sp. NBRC 100390]
MGPVETANKLRETGPNDVALGTGYTITNNEQPGDFTDTQVVEFTVTAKGERVSEIFILNKF